MDFRRFGDTYLIRMDRGEEILSALTCLCEEENIRLAQVDALGAVDHAVVGLYDVSSHTFHKNEFVEPMEISNLFGLINRKDGKPYLHLHVTLCGADGAAHGGHAVELRVSATCEMVIRVLSGAVDRKMDPEIGLNLLEFD